MLFNSEIVQENGKVAGISTLRAVINRSLLGEIHICIENLRLSMISDFGIRTHVDLWLIR